MQCNIRHPLQNTLSAVCLNSVIKFREGLYTDVSAAALSVAVITPKDYPSIWYEEPVVTEMPSDNTAL